VIERRAKHLCEFDVRSMGDRGERVARNQERPRKALRLVLHIPGAARFASIDGVAVEAQGSDEAPFGVVGLEDLDVRGVVDALRGQGGDGAR
jgi:hypothetical protein